MRQPGKRIAVLLHENDRRRDLSGYVVWVLADTWREMGHEVIFLFGPRRFVPADLVLVHVDLSVVPRTYLRFARRYPIVLNGEVKDIRKRTVSENLLRMDDAWDGPVVVKSDLNAAGYPEEVLGATWLARHSSRLRRARTRLKRLLGRVHPLAGSGYYELYDAIADVPPERFRDRRLVVEKFLPEVEEGLYHTRVYQFLGTRANCFRLGSVGPIVKNATAVRVEPIAPHAEIVAVRRRLAMDYGKLDYVVHDGRPVLLDVNKTATAGAAPALQRACRYQAEGVAAYLESGRTPVRPHPAPLPRPASGLPRRGDADRRADPTGDGSTAQAGPATGGWPTRSGCTPATAWEFEPRTGWSARGERISMQLGSLRDQTRSMTTSGSQRAAASASVPQ